MGKTALTYILLPKPLYKYPQKHLLVSVEQLRMDTSQPGDCLRSALYMIVGRSGRVILQRLASVTSQVRLPRLSRFPGSFQIMPKSSR